MPDSSLTDASGLTEAQFLANYDANAYEHPSLTVDMLIFTVMDLEQDNYRKLPQKSLQLLLIKRGEHPYLGQWALPGGFVAVDESIEDAARRELYSETNIEDLYMEQLFTWGDVHRDPRTRVISCSYMALVDRATLDVRAGDDATEAAWFDVSYSIEEEHTRTTEQGRDTEKRVRIKLQNEQETLSGVVRIVESVQGRVKKLSREVIESQGIAFDHSIMIEYAIERLRGKAEYTDIVFNLMPPLFTLSELQRVYEIILGKELLAAAFRRKMADAVTETEEYTKDAGHRPSKLYRFNSEWSHR